MITKELFLAEINKIKFNENITNQTTVKTTKSIIDCNKKSWEITDFDNKSNFINMHSITGMSTAANAKIINLICQSLSEEQCYVNIGVYHGFSMIAGLLDTICKVEGVDNFSQFANPKNIFFQNYNQYKRDNSSFFDNDYRDYLKNKIDSIDFYFYDGPHTYTDQYNAIEMAKHLIKKDTIIMIDDTNLNEVESATFNALNANKFNYDIWLNIRTAHNKHPTYWNGLIVLQII